MPQRRLIAACALAILVSVSAAVAVSAHARVKVSTPSKGEVIVTPPSIVDITFTQEIQKVAGSYEIKVVRDRGASVTARDAKIDESDRTKLSVALSPSLTQGRREDGAQPLAFAPMGAHAARGQRHRKGCG